MGNDLSKEPYDDTVIQKIKDVEKDTNPLYSFWRRFDSDIKEVLKTKNQSDTFLNRMTLGLEDLRFSMLYTRQIAIHHFSFAIPDERALEMIEEYSRNKQILEIGCGTGYWSKLLRQKGCDVIAVDTNSEFPEKNHHIDNIIEMDGEEFINQYDTRNMVLLMIWPRDCDIFLKNFHGEYVIWIGETDGATGEISDDTRWKPVESHVIPCWPGLHDYMLVYKSIKDVQ